MLLESISCLASQCLQSHKRVLNMNNTYEGCPDSFVIDCKLTLHEVSRVAAVSDTICIPPTPPYAKSLRIRPDSEVRTGDKIVY